MHSDPLTGSGHGRVPVLIHFYPDTLDNLESKHISLLRLDGGYHSKEVLDFVEDKNINYIIAARFCEPLQNAISGLKSLKLEEGINVSEMSYQSLLWESHRRVVVRRTLTYQ